MSKKRDYDYDTKYENSASQVKHREERNKARYDVAHHLHTAIKGSIKGKDIDHKKSLEGGGDNKPSNWRIRSVHSNRGDKSFKK
jgi:hypothetical protein